MDRIALTKLPENAPPRAPSSSPSNSRLRAIMALIQQYRVSSGLTPLQESEFALYLPTWTNTLKAIPDNLLMASFERAIGNHEWPKPFAVPTILKAYEQILVEDRARIERERYLNNRNSPETYACRWCSDTGYPQIAIWCKSFAGWRVGVMPCECQMAPISQRRPFPALKTWQRDEMGIWRPASQDDSLPCSCLFCKNHKGGNNDVRQSTRHAANDQDQFAGQSPGYDHADSDEYYGSSRDEAWEEFDI